MCWPDIVRLLFRRRRIGKTPKLQGQPKLFGGSLEEYLEDSNQDIPTILKSCVRVINLYGLHHQGLFRQGWLSFLFFLFGKTKRFKVIENGYI